MLVSIGCSLKKQNNNMDWNRFKIPVIIQQASSDLVASFIEDNVVETWPVFIGQFKFTDTIYFQGIVEKRESLTKDQYLWEHKAFMFDTLTSDGLQVVPDYKSKVIYQKKDVDTIARIYYPVYVVNETSASKIFPGNHRTE